MGGSLSISTHNWVLSLKLLLISTGILSMAMALNLTIPLLSHFILSEGPSICKSFFLALFRPPYLYILLNSIILTIAATSKFHHHSPPQHTAVLPPHHHLNISGDVRTEYDDSYNGVVSEGYVYDANSPTKKKMPSNGEIKNGDSDDAILTHRNETTSLQRKEDSLDFAFPNENEKSPVNWLGCGGAADGNVALGVAKPKQHETLESTWKTIIEGRRHAPLGELNGGDCGGAPNSKVVKKSEAFTCGEENTPPAAGSEGRMRKEASLSQDELNRRVEAFIKKFNEEMRLQRLESLRQYQKMMNPGDH